MASDAGLQEESPAAAVQPNESQKQNDYPLAQLYERGEDVYERAQRGELPATGEAAVNALREGREWLELCLERIDQLSLFSSNEELEDVATGDLKYLLVPWMLSELLQRQTKPNRLQIVRAARSHLSAFISRCEQLGLLPAGEKAALAREGPIDLAMRRAEKIARFKRQKEGQAKLDELRRRKEDRRKQRRRRQGAAGEGANEEEEEGGEEEEEEEGDDEQDERQARLVQIELAVGEALDTTEGLAREELMLVAVEEAKKTQEEGPYSKTALEQRQLAADDFHRTGRQRALSRETPSMQPISCATFAQDVIEGRANQRQAHTHRLPTVGFGPVSLMGGARGQTHRQRVQARVFQPSHSLPRMSIEQAGDRELAIMNGVTKRNEALVAEAAAANAVNGSYEGEREEGEDEAAEYKARAWDDWTDEHPRGQGNSKLTPCG